MENLDENGIPFFSQRHRIGLMMNIDCSWFQPFKHRTYAIGVNLFSYIEPTTFD